MRKVCEFSQDRAYRYTLWRDWGAQELMLGDDRGPNWGRYVMFIGLNPSTADERQDDPTIRRCVGFAKFWGYGALCMTNLFAYRATKPKDMKAHPAPVGPENDKWLAACAKGAGVIIAAWGAHGKHLGRGAKVAADIGPLYCLGQNDDGSPGHPLYAPYTKNPYEFFA